MDIEELIGRLKNVDGSVRYRAVRSLGRLKDARAVSGLIEALKDADWNVRWRAVEALGDIGNPKAVPALIETLKDADKDVRGWAVEALVKIGEAAVPALIDALKDADVWVRRQAVEALVKLAPKAEIDLSEVASALRSYVGNVGEKGVESDTKMAKKEGAGAYKRIAGAVAESRKGRLGGDGVLLVRETVKAPETPDNGMFRQRRIAHG